MAFPFRDLNVQTSPDAYTFTSPSSPNAPALSIDRPTGDVRLVDGSLVSGKRASRIASVAGILGMIRLRLGTAHDSRPPHQVPTLTSHR
jgi:phosphatidylinositol 4-phosphatase